MEIIRFLIIMFRQKEQCFSGVLFKESKCSVQNKKNLQSLKVKNCVDIILN